MKKGKGILLYSGGLDSLLAAKLLMDQGLEITGFHCILPFVDPDQSGGELELAGVAEQINLPIHFYRCGKEYLDMVKNPPHGYGKNMNPCIDCHIFMFKKAAEFMDETGADFIATGEVVGQRPMSQLKNTLNHIIKESNLEGRLLRPLSAKILKPTIVEEEGIVDREKLLDISGRGRKRQMELAEKYGIKNFSSPAGGCQFTDKFISQRIKDLFDHHSDYDTPDIFLLTIGRHFRIDQDCKIIVSRNEQETIILEKYMDRADLSLIPEFKGPMVYLKGNISEDKYEFIASILARYGKPETPSDMVTIFKNGIEIKKITTGHAVSDEILDQLRI